MSPFKDLEKILKKDYRLLPKKKGSSSIYNFNFLDLLDKWECIVGPFLYSHTRPLKISKTKLHIVSDHPAFSQQLNFLQKDIIKKLTSVFPSLKSLREISFQTHPELFKQQQKKVKKKPSNTPSIHHLSPLYQKLKKEAEETVKRIHGETEFSEVLEKIYFETLLRKNAREDGLPEI